MLVADSEIIAPLHNPAKVEHLVLHFLNIGYTPGVLLPLRLFPEEPHTNYKFRLMCNTVFSYLCLDG